MRIVVRNTRGESWGKECPELHRFTIGRGGIIVLIEAEDDIERQAILPAFNSSKISASPEVKVDNLVSGWNDRPEFELCYLSFHIYAADPDKIGPCLETASSMMSLIGRLTTQPATQAA